jgi:choline dehydrogenase-like flavoprotein
LTYLENEQKIIAEMNRWAVDILKSAGAEILRVAEKPSRNHEIGGARMGTDPRTSVTNAFGQTHDVSNLFLADASIFPSASEKNPTHTIMALAARTADHIAERLRKGEL